MNYRYIQIGPRVAPLEQVLDANSEYTKGVARELALVNAADALLSAARGALIALSQKDLSLAKETLNGAIKQAMG